jgi:hypothetical protein
MIKWRVIDAPEQVQGLYLLSSKQEIQVYTNVHNSINISKINKGTGLVSRVATL